MTTPGRAALLGVAAGFVGGLLGVGGGLVIVPGLVLWLHLTQHHAHATSVAAIVASATAAAIPFAANGDVDVGAAFLLFAGAGVGAFIGARAIGRIPAPWLARAFVALAVVAAVRLGISG
ncbi:MAG: TSUP family transporter [Acidimicrobiia bacterium]